MVDSLCVIYHYFIPAKDPNSRLYNIIRRNWIGVTLLSGCFPSLCGKLGRISSRIVKPDHPGHNDRGRERHIDRNRYFVSPPVVELCADVIVSAAARRSISVGGGGAPPGPKKRKRRGGAGWGEFVGGGGGRRSFSGGGGGAPPVQKNRRRRCGAAWAAKNIFF